MRATIKKRWFFLLVLWWLFGNSVPAWCDPVKPQGTTAHTTTIQIRHPDPAKLKAFREDPAFQYTRDIRPAASFWSRFWFKVGRFIDKILGAKSYGSFWRYFIYALGIGITGYVVLKLFRVDFVGLFNRRSTAVAIPYETYRENIHEINFQQLIAEAEEQGDYRRAVRLYYLSILKNLTDNELIDWRPAKTNRSYVAEIASAGLRRAFANITSSFEYVWYGNAALNEARFKDLREHFQEFSRLIKAQT